MVLWRRNNKFHNNIILGGDTLFEYILLAGLVAIGWFAGKDVYDNAKKVLLGQSDNISKVVDKAGKACADVTDKALHKGKKKEEKKDDTASQT